MTININGQINSTGNRRINQPQTTLDALTEALSLSSLHDVPGDQANPLTGRVAQSNTINAPDVHVPGHLNRINAQGASHASPLPIAAFHNAQLTQVKLDQLNRKFAFNLFVDKLKNGALSVSDLTALHNALNQHDDRALTQVAQLVFDGLPISKQVFDLSDKCAITQSSLDELDNPVSIQPTGVFELKALLKWWLAKGTNPLTQQEFTLAQLEKVSVSA